MQKSNPDLEPSRGLLAPMPPIYVPFNRPYLCGQELEYIRQAAEQGHLSGDGPFSARCHQFFKSRFGFKHSLLTTSCTDALEMAALLLDIQPGDEVIVPSFTFVSTANAFALRGARLVFADSCDDHPNIDCATIEQLITPRTKALVAMHYAGMACDMDAMLVIARRHGLRVVEDAAQAFNATYHGRMLGTIGDFGTLSFHETKNIISGEGGLLIVNDAASMGRAEILREKGTNRCAFFRGEVDKYRWIDIGSSFLPSDLLAAFLYAQLENFEHIQGLRLAAWQRYAKGLAVLQERGLVRLPAVPEGATNNGHIFYLICRTADERTALLAHLKNRGINAVIHYQALHQSPYYAPLHGDRPLPNAECYSECLFRLPLFSALSEEQSEMVIRAILEYFTQRP